MKNKINNQRRNFLKTTGITAAAAVSYPSFLRAANSGAINKASANFHADVEIELSMTLQRFKFLKALKLEFGKYRVKY